MSYLEETKSTKFVTQFSFALDLKRNIAPVTILVLEMCTSVLTTFSLHEIMVASHDTSEVGTHGHSLCEQKEKYLNSNSNPLILKVARSAIQ